MKIDEAMKKLRWNFNKWGRPVSWQGSGIALSFHQQFNCPVQVPSSRGGEPYTCKWTDFEDDWELVDMDHVLEERNLNRNDRRHHHLEGDERKVSEPGKEPV